MTVKSFGTISTTKADSCSYKRDSLFYNLTINSTDAPVVVPYGDFMNFSLHPVLARRTSFQTSSYVLRVHVYSVPWYSSTYSEYHGMAYYHWYLLTYGILLEYSYEEV